MVVWTWNKLLMLKDFLEVAIVYCLQYCYSYTENGL
jgi:hypothetical protein